MPIPADTADHRYLAFVDGLRAVAILSVVGCHLGLPGFAGGYIGVDVFFVISGFLIINQIRDGLEKDRFSILGFYARRALRILPPFLVMILCVILVAPLILPTPAIHSDFVRSAIASPLMLANILFYRRQGYFDISANEKPLLHTWTLSVEEQFYFVAPLLLLLVFRLGQRRFGRLAVAIGLALAALSLAGAILQTTTSGPNAAFYLMHWRMWEFIAGGFIGGSLVVAFERLPRAIAGLAGWTGALCIVVATVYLDSSTPYPSWRALLPVAGAVLIIVAGLAQPRIAVARLLALPFMVGIGLVSYSWYLWHWPILAYLRVSRLGELEIVADVIGGGVVAFLLACASYRYLELPIRRWRRTAGAMARPGRIFGAGVAVCWLVAALGGGGGMLGYLWISSYVASAYGTDGKGSLDNGCRLLAATSIPSHCLDRKVAMLLGDSHANAMYGSLARSFDQFGLQLIYVGRGGCDPMRFGGSERKRDRAHNCANLLGPFEQLLDAGSPLVSVVVTPAWTELNSEPRLWTELISQFDASQVRVLLIAPAPAFIRPSLHCVVLSDRFGRSRERCARPRADVERDRAPIVKALKAAVQGVANVRLIDPIELFCDPKMCRPFIGNHVFYGDGSHLLIQGTDRVFDRFQDDFRWVAWRADR